MERKKGVVVHGRPDQGWWFVRVGDTSSLETYFLHISNIRSGTSCLTGCAVEFEVGPITFGKTRPLALKADIIGGLTDLVAQ
jgi:hypothetical protein